jgi:uncharacterized damage-inducible protein DinB
MDTSSTNPKTRREPEPWLRGTLAEIPAVVRGVLHALELAREDVAQWCGTLTLEQLVARPFGLPAVAFQLRHIARSQDRLLTYAEGRELSAEQLAALRAEMLPCGSREELLLEFETALQTSGLRVRALSGADLEQARFVGKMKLPSTVGGLLVHVADHTQRHVGQAVTTAKVVIAG